MASIIDYYLFAAKWFTVLLTIVAGLAGLIVLILSRSRSGTNERIEVKNLNERFASMELALKSSILTAKAFKQEMKKTKRQQKERDRTDAEEPQRRRIFVCNFKGDMRASAVTSLRDEITAILGVARPQDEVIAVIESPGGTIHGYGLAASQLRRIRDRGILLTAAVDKVAASGGYMMACVANKIIAAPFAIVGSIGVVAQLPNFNRLLKKHDIDFEEITAGKYKRTLTVFGENTDEDRHKFQEELEDAHRLFKEFVSENRPIVDIDAVATGEHWFGRRAVDLKLVDELRTSDDYLATCAESADIYEIKVSRKKSLVERLFGGAARMMNLS